MLVHRGSQQGLDLASTNMWWELQDADLKEKAGEAAVRVCLSVP